jgi:hypothetical protein
MSARTEARSPRAGGRLAPAAILALAALAGCGTPGDRAGPTAPAPASGTAAGGAGTAAGTRTLRYYHGVEVRLELPPGDGLLAARIERLDAGDRIVCGDISLAHRFQRFETAAGGRYHFEPGSRVFVFRPPPPGSPWESRSAEVAIVWAGDGALPPVQEDRRGGVVLWHFGRSRVERAADGTILHHHGGEDRRLRAPVTLLLGPNGELLESRPGVR